MGGRGGELCTSLSRANGTELKLIEDCIANFRNIPYNIYYLSTIMCIQVNCEESPEWIVPCSLDPPTVDDEGIDTWFKIGKVLMYMCYIHMYVRDYTLCSHAFNYIFN